ncbi:MAG: phosphatidate cytidylyltransferase [Chloroflexi bacterium]|nr:phosphatidate cytidylyltransferase [Chloroflexota bacterium]MBV9894009.1 phosphatidate cytidylyltransferase [Chloroflexota bacterium]
MLLSNPIASPMWPTLAWTFGGLFGGSLVALLITAHGRWQELSGSVLFRRWRTWIAIAAVFSVATLSGPIALALFVGAVAVVASHEYARLFKLPAPDAWVLRCAAVAVPLAALVVAPISLTPLFPLVAALPALCAQDVKHGANRLGRLAFGLWYVPLTLAMLVSLEGDPRGGPGLVLALALATALSDVGAFTFGKLFGRYTAPLAARLSPSKTVAGLGGNLAGAALGVLLLRPAAPAMWLLIMVVAVGSVWGDLLESLLKRAAGAKDAGTWLPGFGGVLDRVDSLLIVLPLATAALALSA